MLWRREGNSGSACFVLAGDDDVAGDEMLGDRERSQLWPSPWHVSKVEPTWVGRDGSKECVHSGNLIEMPQKWTWRGDSSEAGGIPSLSLCECYFLFVLL